MPADLRQAVEQATGRRITDQRAASGGCINEAYLFTLDDGRRVFAKTHAQASRYPGMFESEAAGLAALAEAESSLHVPRPIDAGPTHLIMEAIEESGGGGLAEKLGRGLAELHRNTPSDRFGFDVDNYLGSTPQTNGWHDDWVTFWAERRLKPMLDHVRGNGELDKLGAKLLDRIDDVLAEPGEPAVLLHGDLWSGNATTNGDGRAVIFDPATYYGHREAEFGMTRLFGFGAGFEAAYEEVYPLADGADRRIKVYTLHHLLNHLYLFGGGYLGSCVSTLRGVL